MSTELATRDPGSLAEQVAIAGDLSKLNADQRMAYYGEVCRSLGLNPLTKPFQYLQLNGKLVLYATRDCTDQLRSSRRVSINIISRERLEDVYVVTARATTPDGRTDESTGVVSMGNLRGDNLANALMKAETKAKRRVTLSICGLGWMDESELETVPQARIVNPDDPASFNPQPEQPGPAVAAALAPLQARCKTLRTAEIHYAGAAPAFSVADAKDPGKLNREIARSRRSLAAFARIPEYDTPGALDHYEDTQLITLAAEECAHLQDEAQYTDEVPADL